MPCSEAHWLKHGVGKSVSKFPLWGQKPSIPVWVTYLLQAEMLWSFVVSFTLGMLFFDDEMFEHLSTEAMIFTGLLVGGIVGPFIRGAVRAVLKIVSWIVCRYVGPPPKGYDYWKK